MFQVTKDPGVSNERQHHPLGFSDFVMCPRQNNLSGNPSENYVVQLPVTKAIWDQHRFCPSNARFVDLGIAFSQIKSENLLASDAVRLSLDRTYDNYYRLSKRPKLVQILI